MVRISELDMIKLLRKNARMSFVDIAKKLNVTEAAVRKKMKSLESRGVIKGYTVLSDPKKLGYNIDAIIGLDSMPEELVHVVKKLKKMKEILNLYMSSGDHMVMMECWFKDNEELSNFIMELEKIHGVTKVCPATILEKIK